jgi:hypothetical protein
MDLLRFLPAGKKTRKVQKKVSTPAFAMRADWLSVLGNSI